MSWRGTYLISKEIKAKYPDVDIDYLEGILGECYEGGIESGRSEVQFELKQCIDKLFDKNEV